MSGVITSVMVLIAMLFLTPLLYHLPQSVLAAVIMMAVLSLINVQGFLKTWQSRRFDGIVATATFLGTLTFAPHLEYGILIGVSLSLLNLLHGHLRPEIALLSKLPDGSFRNAVRWNLKMCRYIGVVRVHGSLFFASAHYLEESIYDEVESLPHIRHVLLESNGMNELDATGIQTVDNLVHWLRDRNIQVSFVGLSDSIMDTFKRTHLAELIGADHFYHNIQLAIDAVHADAHAEGEEEICPLVTTCYID